MNKKLFVACFAVCSLALLACSDDSISGSSEDPSVLTAEKNQSSGSDLILSSTSVEGSSSSAVQNTSSSSKQFILCKAGGDSGGCFATSYGDLWATGLSRVKTGTWAEDSSGYGNRAGELFYETSFVEGGKSQIIWDDGSTNSRVVEFGKGYLSAIVQLDDGELDKDSYVNVGFSVAGFDSDGVPVSADISNWNGICVSYVSSVDVSLQLDLGDSINQKIDFALPSVTLEKGQSVQCFEWKRFEQSKSGKEHVVISGEDAAKRVVNVVFHFQSSERLFGFKIISIGTNRDE